MTKSRPSPDELLAARGKRVRDVIASRLDVLFCGINPGLYSGAVGHHFARPGNRFWKVLQRAGFTDVVVSPFDERALLGRGLGITNLVNYATASEDDLDPADLRRGRRRLVRTARKHRPRFIAVVGIGAYRTAFESRRATVGEQPMRIGSTRVWVLPNPSGRTAGYQLAAMSRAFRALRRAVDRERRG